MTTIPQSILITQCLQNDFCCSVEPWAPLPNLLHIGYSESRRLLGEVPAHGPVQRVMEWAYATKPADLKIIHIRDWHDPNDKSQKNHFESFGPHCLVDSKGAEFVFKQSTRDAISIVNASGLNDFQDTDLLSIMEPFANAKIKVGLIGVWTDAKISFLAYELATRYPDFEIALCSALTASPSRLAHFTALDSLKNLLATRIIASPASFCRFLAGSEPVFARRYAEKLEIEIEPAMPIEDVDKDLIGFLFRDSKRVQLKVMDGGFSGNLVFRSRSWDQHGRQQVTGVVKIGDRDLIAKERESFERIQEVMGNSAPQITEIGDRKHRGAIKYRYASMGTEKVTVFQDLYAQSDLTQIHSVLDKVFKSQLGRLYAAVMPEKTDLFSYWDFKPKYATSIQAKIEALDGVAIEGDKIMLAGSEITNVVKFYTEDLTDLKFNRQLNQPFAWVHGDLNGRNIIIDDQNNIWLIDFFHTHYGHVLRDLIKLENDIMFIFTRINNQEDLEQAFRLSAELFAIEDLGAVPFGAEWFKMHSDLPPAMQKCAGTIQILRSYYSELIGMMRDPIAWHLAMLRYAMHTLSFDESSSWQRKWALYTGSRCVDKIRQRLSSWGRIRIDAVELGGGMRLGMTVLPGRKDWQHKLKTDLDVIVEEGYQCIVCLVPSEELGLYGVDNLLEEYAAAGLEYLHAPVKDQGAPSLQGAKDIVDWIGDRIQENKHVLLHCVGGLGRTGTLAACYLIEKENFSAENAIREIRNVRSNRAIESLDQEEFIRNFA